MATQLDILASVILALICSAIALRIIAFDRSVANTRFRPGYGLAAWCLVVLSGSIAILSLSGGLCMRGPAILLIPISLLLCILIFVERGNIASAFRKLRGSDHGYN